jgi:putative membrane protein
MHALRGERSLGRAAVHLPPEQVEAVFAEKNIPMAVATRIGRLIANKRTGGNYPERVIITIDSVLRALMDSHGACERIRDTPLPFAYVVHLRRAVGLFLLTLPCALVEQFGWETVGYMALISYVLLGIDEIGVEIENPFGSDPNDLPLEKICAGIESDLTSVLTPAAELPPFERPKNP